MGMMNKVMGFLGLSDEEEVDERERVGEDDVQAPELRKNAKASVVSLHAQKTSKMVLHEPRSYDEVQDIADHLRSRRAVVVNLQRVRPDHMVRIVDFLSGTVYALNGNIQKIGAQIFLCVPDNVEVQGSISEMFASAESSTNTKAAYKE